MTSCQLIGKMSWQSQISSMVHQIRIANVYKGHLVLGPQFTVPRTLVTSSQAATDVQNLPSLRLYRNKRSQPCP